MDGWNTRFLLGPRPIFRGFTCVDGYFQVNVIDIVAASEREGLAVSTVALNLRQARWIWGWIFADLRMQGFEYNLQPQGWEFLETQRSSIYA